MNTRFTEKLISLISVSWIHLQVNKAIIIIIIIIVIIIVIIIITRFLVKCSLSKLHRQKAVLFEYHI